MGTSRTVARRSLAAFALLFEVGCGYDFGKYQPPVGNQPIDGCAAHPGVTFCEDFDDVADVASLTAKWQGTSDGSGTLVIAEEAGAPSPSHALSATAGSSDHISLSHATFPGKPSTIHLEYDLRVDANSISGMSDGAALTGIEMGTVIGVSPEVSFFLGSTGLELQWLNPATGLAGIHTYAFDGKVAVGEWSGRWVLDITMGDGTMQVTHDGASVGVVPDKLPAVFLLATDITLVAGLPYNTGNTGKVGVTIDDLLLDLK